jgi:hypothetical protein
MPPVGRPGGGGRGVIKVPSLSTKFPLTVAPSGRYFINPVGNPVLLNSCSQWGLIAGLSLANAKDVVDKRVAQGFNTFLVCLVIANDTVPPGTETWQGSVQAFNTPGNYSTPNSTYFSHADDVLAYCESKGVFVWLVPIYLGWFGGAGSGSWDTMGADTDAHLASYGTYVGNRYNSFKNVGWCLGGDQYAEFRNATTASREQAMATALKAATPNQIFTAHLDSSGDATRFQDSGMNAWDGTEYRTNLAPPYGFNGHYAFAEQSGTPVYTRNRLAYNLSPPMPTGVLDPSYEGEVNGSAMELRRRQYRVMCEGGAAGGYNSGATWYGYTDWTTVTTGQTENIYWWNFWSSIPWQTLVPDQSNSVVTAGRGTYGAQDYVCAAASSTLLAAYFPDGGANTITIAMSSFSKSMRARWYDPTSGVYSLISASIANSGTQNFSNPGANTGGSTDWVLILD